jgi:CDP-paratose 2-epimerase
MRILCTGSTGLVGSEAVKFFRDLGHEVVGVDNNMRAYFFDTPDKEPEVRLDIRDETAVNALIKDGQFDVLIHTAAQPSHDWSKQEPITDFDVNARGTLLLLEAVRKFSPRTIFVHCSTDKIYGEGMRRNVVELDTRYHSSTPFDEITEVDQSVHSLFGVSKLAADMYVQEYGFQFGVLDVDVSQEVSMRAQNNMGSLRTL